MHNPWIIHGAAIDYSWTIHGYSMDNPLTNHNPWMIHGSMLLLLCNILTNIGGMRGEGGGEGGGGGEI